MITFFDYYNQYEIPTFILCQPDRTELYSLGTIYNRKWMPRFNALSSISFTAPASVDGVNTDYFDSLTYRRVIYIPDIGYFMITEVDERNDGIIREKDIVAYSLEIEFNLKKVTLFKGTYKFYDPITPAGTLINELLSYVKGWTVGTIDTSLAILYRTFNVSDTTIYNLLMTQIEDAFQCVFVFDTINKTINAYTVPNAVTQTDIYLSHNNLINTVDIKEVTEELVTALSVYGGGNLSINQVNPLGTDIIYDFTYYKTTAWMSQSLIDAIDAWEANIAIYQPIYASLLTSLRDAYVLLYTKEGELAVLEAAYLSLEGVQKVRIQQGIDYSDISAQMVAKQAEINSKIGEINSLHLTIGDGIVIAIPGSGSGGSSPPSGGSLLEQLTEINTFLSFDEAFTSTQLTELDHYIVGNTYQNENFIQTDLMTQDEIQDQAQALYDQAEAVLAKVAQPRYEFSIDAINFMFLKDFQTFITQLVLGAVVNLEIRDNLLVYPALLGMDLNYDDPTEFSLIFGNRMRLDNSSFIFSDLFGQTVQQGISTSFNSEQWSSWTNNYQDDVSTFITSSLDASLNNIINATNQEILINQNGLKGRTYSASALTYSPEQVWLTSNTLAFTKDNWQTASLAIGKIASGSSMAYGVVGDVIVGKILAGNQLTITNENKTFTVDGAGATLSNATLSIVKTNSKIFLDPNNGIKIDKYVGGAFNKTVFSVDSAGNAIFAGTLSGADGTFSGALSAATITGGTITGASISGGTISGTTGIFSGNIYAANLQGQVTDSQISSLNAAKITTGTMSANRIYGGIISWSGGTLDMNNYGQARLRVTDVFRVDIATTSSAELYVSNTGIYTTGLLSSTGLFVTGNASITGYINVSNYVNANQYYAAGQAGLNVTLNTYSGYQNWVFTRGILTNYY